MSLSPSLSHSLSLSLSLSLPLSLQLKAHPGDVSLVVLIPTPRTRTFSAAAITPDQVVEVKADFEVKESDAVKGSVTLDITVEWEELNTQSIYYQLRVVRENTTGSIEALHELQLVRKRFLTIYFHFN